MLDLRLTTGRGSDPMSEASLFWLRDSRLRPLALSRLPVWAWALEPTRVIWANPTGAAMLGATTPAALTARRFDADQPIAAQIGRLAASLPEGADRLERLPGLGSGIGGLTCRCSRVTLADGSGAILITAAEPAGPQLPLPEQVDRLLADCEEAVAAFANDGMLIHARPAAQARLGGARTLAAIGAETLAATGAAEGLTAVGWISIDRIGSEPVLLVTFGHATTAGQVARQEAPLGTSPRADDAATRAACATPTLGATFSATADPEAAAWRHPLRFVWQIDAEGRFTLDSQEFTALAGPRTAAALGRSWDDVSAALGLDPDGQIARALATRETWSGLTVGWPVDDGGEQLAVELSGLPVFDRERSFRGYRGFGVCRTLARHIAERAPDPETKTSTTDTIAPDSAAFCEPTALTPIDNQPFEELARGFGGRFTSSADDKVEDIVTEFDQDLLLEAETEPATAVEIRLMLDRFPVGVLIYRLNDLIYANRVFLRWAGYDSLAALNEAGGLDALLIESGSVAFEQGGDKPFALSSGRDGSAPCEARLFLVPWQGDSAFALVTMPAGAMSPTATVPAAAPGADTTPAATADDAPPAAPADEASPAAPADDASPAAPADDASPAAPADDASPAA